MPPPRPADSPQWPPRSPHEALLSTPGGRDRLRRIAERTSPSPSPSKRAQASARRGANSLKPDDTMDLDLDGDEDEEMLELKLAAIKAKLKLKKLQHAKAKGAPETGTTPAFTESRSIPDHAPLSRAQSRANAVKSDQALRPEPQVDIQVPASPVRKVQAPLENTSPSRIRLGIDKGLRAKDVSLKRAPRTQSALDTAGPGQGSYFKRPEPPSLGRAPQPRPKTFSERLAAARTEESSRQERQERIKEIRTNAFKLGKEEMNQLKQSATEIPDIPLQGEQYSRDEVMAGGRLKRSNTMPDMEKRTPYEAEDETANSFGLSTAKSTATRKKKVPPADIPEDEASAIEPYSATQLSKRIIPHTTLTREISDKKAYMIKDLLKHVKAPDFQLPDVEQDVVVFGILASKSEPRAHQNTGNHIKEKKTHDPTRGKYMILTLVDLTWEIQLFLFNSGFERYWKLTPGTLIAILNPTIMPPPPNRTDTGAFSLVINSDDDSILEVGTARDLGFCKSVKKDGEQCGKWVNRKRTEFCQFHMNLALDKKRLARQDVNAFNLGLGPSEKKHNSYRLHNWEEHANDPNKSKRGNYNRDTQTAWFMRPASAAQILDNEVLGGEHGKIASTIEKKEALKRRLATEEKERNLMKKLGEVGSGAGRDYMNTTQSRRRAATTTTTGQTGLDSSLSTADEPRQLDAKSLGLIGGKRDIHLSPVKRKRVESALSSRSSSTFGSSIGTGPNSTSANAKGKQALGWGGGLKEKLARMKDGEKVGSDGSLDQYLLDAGEDREKGKEKVRESRSPARKKTRFVTEKGIREAGRESLGTELAGGKGLVELSDEDELVIV
ncbi:hypothetical protein F5Y18DRAFT_442403 [Xylariaceae sp. FL1019]|nr:hypothetical protein F5Y18DRAFT_442403 [Xylariaceae sp. FL1019]